MVVLSRPVDSSSLLQRYAAELTHHPLRTKAITSGTLAFIQEITAQIVSVQLRRHFIQKKSLKEKDEETKAYSGVDLNRAVKMFLYGFLVSGPLAHYMYSKLAQVFFGRRGAAASILQLLVSNLVISPFQNTVFVIAMTIIAGGATLHDIQENVRRRFIPMMKVVWVVAPIVQTFAYRFLPPETWSVVLNLVAFVFGTSFNTLAKLKAVKSSSGKEKEE